MNQLTIRAADGDFQVSRVILGACNFGTFVDKETSLKLLDRYVELGGNCIDTASVYGDWEDTGTPVSEELLGEWMASRGVRDKVTIITKGGHYRLKKPQESRATPDCVREDIEKSLKALGVGTIDIYFLHRDNPGQPVEGFIDLLDEYVKAGKIRAIGTSNWPVSRIRQANAYAKQAGKTPFAVSEIQWSLATPAPAPNGAEYLYPMTKEDYQGYLQMGMPVLAWSSQASGIITKAIEKGMENLSEPLRKKYDNPPTNRSIKMAEALCKTYGVTPTQAALGYITCNRLPAAAIIGPRKLEQLEDSWKAMGLELPPEAVENMKWD